MKLHITALSTITAALLAATLPLTSRAAEVITDPAESIVKLYDDENFGDNVLIVKFRTDIPTLNNVTWDGKPEKGHPNDRITAVRFQIPKGWKLVLFENSDYKKASFELKGTGKLVELAKISFSDKTSSLRWEEDPQ